MKNKTRAFSLIELLVAISIIAVVLAIGIPGINAARDKAEVETMRTRAIALQNAKAQLVNAVGPATATTSWTGAANDEARYDDLLRPYLPESYPDALTTLIPSPFSINLGSTAEDTVTLTDSASATIPLLRY